MKREYDEVSYTEEDLRNIEVKEYSKEELEENFNKVKGKKSNFVYNIYYFWYTYICIYGNTNFCR